MRLIKKNCQLKFAGSAFSAIVIKHQRTQLQLKIHHFKYMSVPLFLLNTSIVKGHIGYARTLEVFTFAKIIDFVFVVSIRSTTFYDSKIDLFLFHVLKKK